MLDILGDSSLAQVNGLAITAALGVVVISLALWTIVRPSGFPPGPRGVPILGSLMALNDSMEVVFTKWAKLYGDVYGFKVGERWMVVLNHQEAIKEAVVKQGVDFAGRPDFPSLSSITDGFKDIAFSPYSETWKLQRKVGHTALRHFATGKPLQDLISSMYPKVDAEVAKLEGKPVNPKQLLTLLVYNILSQMCLGKRYEMNDPQLLEWVKMNDEFNEKIGMGFLEDIFAFAKYLPFNATGKKALMDLSEKQKKFISEELSKHRESHDREDITDVFALLIQAQDDALAEDNNAEKLTDIHLIQTIIDLFGAGIQTSTDTLYWALALMAENPDIAAKVQAEIDDVIGRDRNPLIEDRGKVPYTEATLYEVMRYSTIGPTALPHATTRDVKFRGYSIPKGTTVILNLYSMHFDPREWDDPESFKPEHFLDASSTVRQHPPSFMPFGAGRRSCMGEAVAKADLFLIFTWFMQNYNFTKVPGKEAESLLNLIPKTSAGRLLLPYEILIKKREG